ncbi:hypothetical protein HQ544_02055, partial [Candidatus Falkowbacteria bacterium]|nr:hypothetical protein [Candidatus Falkowbacteria bacterium]
MALIPYILGLISSIVTAVIFVLLNRLTGWEIHSLSILFVLPLGGLLLGLGGAAGFFLGRKFTNNKIVKADYI